MRLLKTLTPEQWEKLIYFVENYFLTKPFTVIGILLFISTIVLSIKGNKQKSIQSYKMALVCYLGVVLVFSVLNRDTGSSRELRLYFDSWLLENGSGFHESNILISIIDCLYFIPIGFLVFLNRKDNIFLCLLFVGLLGFSIELIQYVLIRGVASISDFISYCVGGVLGMILVRFIHKP